MLAKMLQDLQCLGKLAVPVEVVAPVEMRIVWVARVQTVREELLVVVEDMVIPIVGLVEQVVVVIQVVQHHLLHLAQKILDLAEVLVEHYLQDLLVVLVVPVLSSSHTTLYDPS